MDAPEHRLPPAPSASPEVLSQILDRHRRRRQWLLSAGIVVALVAGFVGGWSIDRADEFDAVTQTATDTETDTSSETVSATTEVEEFTGTGGLRRLAIRTTGADIDLRLYVSNDPPRNCAADQPCPPPDCLPRTLQGEVSNRESVGTLGAWVEREPGPTELVVLGVIEFGVLEGAPATAVLATAGEAIHTVRLRHFDHTDEMTPSDTFAILGVPGQAPMPTIVGLDADGNEIATARLSPDGGTVTNVLSGCEPVPPALPPETDPPADRDAAEQAVRDVAELVYSASDGQVSDKLVWIEDGEELRSVQDELEERYGGNQADVSITIDEVSFQGPDQATFRYDFFLGGTVYLTDHLGQAVLQDGTWKISRDMWCAMNQRGGVTCPSR